MECNLGLQARETLSCLSCFRSECFIVDVDVNVGYTASDAHVVWGMHQQSLLGQLTQTARVPAGKTQVTERCQRRLDIKTDREIPRLPIKNKDVFWVFWIWNLKFLCSCRGQASAARSRFCTSTTVCHSLRGFVNPAAGHTSWGNCWTSVEKIGQIFFP